MQHRHVAQTKSQHLYTHENVAGVELVKDDFPAKILRTVVPFYGTSNLVKRMLTDRKLEKASSKKNHQSSHQNNKQFLFQSKSFQSKAVAWALLLLAAISFFPVRKHKEFWSLSLFGWTFDSVAGTCYLTVMYTKFHGILATFCRRSMSQLNFVWYVTGTKLV